MIVHHPNMFATMRVQLLPPKEDGLEVEFAENVVVISLCGKGTEKCSDWAMVISLAIILENGGIHADCSAQPNGQSKEIDCLCKYVSEIRLNIKEITGKGLVQVLLSMTLVPEQLF